MVWGGWPPQDPLPWTSSQFVPRLSERLKRPPFSVEEVIGATRRTDSRIAQKPSALLVAIPPTRRPLEANLVSVTSTSSAGGDSYASSFLGIPSRNWKRQNSSRIPPLLPLLQRRGDGAADADLGAVVALAVTPAISGPGRGCCVLASWWVEQRDGDRLVEGDLDCSAGGLFWFPGPSDIESSAGAVIAGYRGADGGDGNRGGQGHLLAARQGRRPQGCRSRHVHSVVWQLNSPLSFGAF